MVLGTEFQSLTPTSWGDARLQNRTIRITWVRMFIIMKEEMGPIKKIKNHNIDSGHK